MNWLRLWNDLLPDPKLRRLPHAQRWLWVALLILSRQSPRPGKLYVSNRIPIRPEELPGLAAVSMRQVTAGLAAFEEQEMIAIEDGVIVILNWDKRQGSPLYEQAMRLRSRLRWRARKEPVIERDGMICGICGGTVVEGDLEIDHIVPVSKGGTSELENLQVTHRRCNRHKGAKL